MSVTPTHAAQLGLLCLGVLDTSPFSTDWTHIHPSILDLQVFRESDRPLISALRQALTDPGLGFYGEHRYVNNELIIRCCIVPSDAIGSTWKRTHVKSSFRSRYLGKIFHALEAGWDGENGEGVLALGVSVIALDTAQHVAGRQHAHERSIRPYPIPARTYLLHNR